MAIKPIPLSAIGLKGTIILGNVKSIMKNRNQSVGQASRLSEHLWRRDD